MKVAFISNLFPDTAEPYRGLDNATLLHHLSAHCEVRVISPRPALPFIRLGRPPRQCRPLDAQFQPLYLDAPYLPKIGSRLNHRLLARALRQPLQVLRREFPFELILCAWTYPDGCAVDLLAPELGAPFLVIAQGSDVHAYLEVPVRRQLIVAMTDHAAGVITRSADLARRLLEAGALAEKLHPIYNGVDEKIFCPADALFARRELNLPAEGKIILFVGNFVPVKNPSLLVAAHAEISWRKPAFPARLVMIGGGPLETAVRCQADALGFGSQVILAGRKNSAEVARFMQAADVLCLSSENEGVPNVVLEAFACGRRVVATNVGGIHEVLSQPFLGRLAERGEVAALADALAQTLAEPANEPQILQHARQFTWPRAAEAYFNVLERALIPI